MREVIFSQGDYALIKYEGTGVNNTPYTSLKVVTSGNAEKYIIDIVLTQDVMHFLGEPVQSTYKDAYINYGISNRKQSLEEILEFSETLKEAVEFTKRVKKFIETSEEWRSKD